MRFILMASLVFLKPALAVENFCSLPPKILEKMEWCDDNTMFVNEAEKCAKKFRHLIKARQKKFAQSLKKIVSGKTNNKQDEQNESYKKTDETQKETNLELIELIAIGTKARAEVKEYTRQLIWPVVWTKEFGPFPGLDDPELQRKFRYEFCYGDNQEGLEDVLAEFDQMLGSLQQAKTISKSLDQIAIKEEIQIQKNPQLVSKGSEAKEGNQAQGFKKNRSKISEEKSALNKR